MSDTDREVSNCFDIINSFSLLPHIILPTRVTSSSSTLIDNIFCNSSDNNSVSGNIISCISHSFYFLRILSTLAPIDKTVLFVTGKFLMIVFLNNIVIYINWNDTMQIEMHAFDMCHPADYYFKLIFFFIC